MWSRRIKELAEERKKVLISLLWWAIYNVSRAHGNHGENIPFKVYKMKGQRKDVLALTTGCQVSYIPTGLDHTHKHTHYSYSPTA